MKHFTSILSYERNNMLYSVMDSLLLFSHYVMSDHLQPHELQHARVPCQSLSPGVCSSSCPWVGEAMQPSRPLSPPPLALNLSQHQGLFQWVSYLPSGDHSIGASASASVLPMNQVSFPLGWTGWISLQSKGLSGVFSSTTVWKHQFFSAQLSLSASSHIHTWL